MKSRLLDPTGGMHRPPGGSFAGNAKRIKKRTAATRRDERPICGFTMT
jgi:hypothetical protein